MVQQYVREFVIETDTTFNTNKLWMSLSGLIGIINTISTFLFTHYFITSESNFAFVFINKCLKDLFLSDQCPEPAIIVGNLFCRFISNYIKDYATEHIRSGNKEIRS